MGNVPSETCGQDVPGDEGEQAVTIPRIIIAAAILLGVLAFIAWYFVNEHSERIRFITVNSLSLLVVVIIAIQSVIYRREWRVMQRGLRQTDKVIETMQGQLDAINEQAGHLSVQAEAAKEAADMAKGQLVALQHQEQAQVAALEQQRTMVAQNERAVKAAEESAKTAQRALEIDEAPYFGITKIEIEELAAGHCPKIRITFMNGGKTPAWNFHAIAGVFVGYRPDLVSEILTIEPELGNLGDTFVPSGQEKTIHYVKTNFRFTEEHVKAMNDDHPQRFFVQGTAHYRNMRGKKMWTEFCGVYYPSTGKFGDYYAT